MLENRDMQDLPTEQSKKIINEISKRIGFDEYTIKLNEGSKKGENFFGEIYKVEITGKRRGCDLKKHLILKLAPTNKSFRESVPVDRYYLREIAAYSSILPQLDRYQGKLPIERRFKFPKFHAAISDKENELVVMEDLSIEGFRLYDRIKSMDFDHAMMSIRNLAWLHATSFAMKRCEPELFKNLSANVCHGMDYGIHFPKFIDKNKNLILGEFEGTEYYDRLRGYLQDMHEKMQHLLDPATSEPYNVICHGDCWTSNILFRYENATVAEARLVDWQVVRLASPVTDLGYLLFTSTDEHFRNHHFHRILEEYYVNLKENLTLMGCDADDCYPREVYDRHLKEILPFGLLIAIVVCPVTICDRDELPNLVAENDIFSDNKNNDTKLSKTPKERLMGGLRDFFKFNLYPK